MTLDVLIKEDKVVFIERYPTVAVMFEPGLKPIINESYQKGSLIFTTSLKEPINEPDIVFIAT